MITPTVAAGKNTSAIGRPDARLFFEPQNSSTMLSPRSSPATRPTSQVKASTTANSTALTAATIASCQALTLRQMTERILIAMGTNRKLVPVPVKALRPIVAVAQRFLPNPPVTLSLLDLLALDNTVANNALTEYFKIVPIPFAADELQYLRRITVRNALRSLFEQR